MAKDILRTTRYSLCTHNIAPVVAMTTELVPLRREKIVGTDNGCPGCPQRLT